MCSKSGMRQSLRSFAANGSSTASLQQKNVRSWKEDERERITLPAFTADIVAAYVTKNVIEAGKLPELIGAVHTALTNATIAATEPSRVDLVPAAPIKKSITQDCIICLEDGKRFKSLKRHIRTHYELTSEGYRAKWGLPSDYPMVAPAYAAARSHLAKALGLGQHTKGKRSPAAKTAKAAAKRARACNPHLPRRPCFSKRLRAPISIGWSRDVARWL
jgi:predicted transcriptional regulator